MPRAQNFISGDGRRIRQVKAPLPFAHRYAYASLRMDGEDFRINALAFPAENKEGFLPVYDRRIVLLSLSGEEIQFPIPMLFEKSLR